MSILVEQQDEQINVIETQAAGVEVDTEVGYVSFNLLDRTHPEQHSVQSWLHRKSRRLRTRRTEKALDLRRYHPHRAHHCGRHRWYRSQQGRRQELQHLRFGHYHHHFLSGATRSTPFSAFFVFLLSYWTAILRDFLLLLPRLSLLPRTLFPIYLASRRLLLRSLFTRCLALTHTVAPFLALRLAPFSQPLDMSQDSHSPSSPYRYRRQL